MNRVGTLIITAVLFLCLGVAFPAEAQTLKDQIVGTWTLASIVNQYQGGRKDTAPFGPDVKGQLMLDRTGRYSLQLIGGNRPKTAGDPRNPVGPAVANFGTYSIGEGDKSLTFHAERATYPAFDGTDAKTTVIIKGDEMTYVRAPIASPAGTFVPTLEWKRVK